MGADVPRERAEVIYRWVWFILQDAGINELLGSIECFGFVIEERKNELRVY